MKEKLLVQLDIASASLMLMWVLLVILHFLFGQVVNIKAVDATAWIAFGGSLLLSGLPRWLNDIVDKEIIGPFRVWFAACTVALIFCMTSSFVVTPKMAELQTLLVTEQMNEQQKDKLKKNYSKVNSVNIQFLCIRAIFALGLSLGLKRVPRVAKI